ncbi:wiskott-aldrich syndrome, partial [Fusarium longipes]
PPGGPGAPPPPPPPPPGGAAPALPAAGDTSRSAMLAGIQQAGGIHSLKKVDRSQIRDRSGAQIGGSDVGGNSATASAVSASGGGGGMADALAAALQKRKEKMMKVTTTIGEVAYQNINLKRREKELASQADKGFSIWCSYARSSNGNDLKSFNYGCFFGCGLTQLFKPLYQARCGHGFKEKLAWVDELSDITKLRD